MTNSQTCNDKNDKLNRVNALLSTIFSKQWEKGQYEGDTPTPPTLEDIQNITVTTPPDTDESLESLSLLSDESLQDSEHALVQSKWTLYIYSLLFLNAQGKPDIADVFRADELWRDTKEIAKKRDEPFEVEHPCVAVVKTWIRRNPPKHQIERRSTQIAPAFLKESQQIEVRDRLPSGVLHNQGETSQQLPLFKENKDQDIVIHALPIEIYKGESGGRGAPLDERVFFNALLARPYGTPEEYNAVRLEPTLRDFVDWLYPNGWNRTYQLPLLQQALHQVHNKRISYERRDWNVVQVLAMPNETTQLDDVLPLIIRYPDGVSGNGPMIDVARMRNYGLVSAPKWRAWIRLHYFWDTSKQRNGGYAIYATRPKVKRDADGYLLDATGNLIVSSDVYKRNGKRYAKKGKEPQTAWYHPQAIHLGVERNPQADKIPVLSREELVYLFFDKSEVDQSTFRRRFKRAVDNLLEFEEEGYVIVEWKAIDTKRGMKGIRILPVLQELDTRSRLS